jgi:hypothetical protein
VPISKFYVTDITVERFIQTFHIKKFTKTVPPPPTKDNEHAIIDTLYLVRVVCDIGMRKGCVIVA